MGPRPVVADDCTPVVDFWFLEEYLINKIEPVLPPDIRLETSPMSSRGFLQIANHGDQPAYLIPRSEYPDIVTETRPTGSIEGLAEEDQSSQTVLLIDQVPGHASTAIDSSQTLTLDINNIPDLVDERFKDHNTLTDSWGSFIVLPPPQRTDFYLVYAEQLYQVTFTIAYRLKPDFRGRACQEELDSAVQPTPQFTEIGNKSVNFSSFAFIVILIPILFLFFWLYRKRKPSEDRH